MPSGFGAWSLWCFLKGQDERRDSQGRTFELAFQLVWEHFVFSEGTEVRGQQGLSLFPHSDLRL